MLQVREGEALALLQAIKWVNTVFSSTKKGRKEKVRKEKGRKSMQSIVWFSKEKGGKE